MSVNIYLSIPIWCVLSGRLSSLLQIRCNSQRLVMSLNINFHTLQKRNESHPLWAGVLEDTTILGTWTVVDTPQSETVDTPLSKCHLLSSVRIIFVEK